MKPDPKCKLCEPSPCRWIVNQSHLIDALAYTFSTPQHRGSNWLELMLLDERADVRKAYYGYSNPWRKP